MQKIYVIIDDVVHQLDAIYIDDDKRYYCADMSKSFRAHEVFYTAIGAENFIKTRQLIRDAICNR